MTWRENYWDDATQSPDYFESVEFATVLDGDYGTRMFGRWIAQMHPDRHDLIRSLEYLLVTYRHGDDVQATLDTFERQLPRPWDDWAMTTALTETARRNPDVPVELRDDDDFAALAEQLRDDAQLFALWREEVQQAAVMALSVPEVMPAFVTSCQTLAAEAHGYGDRGKEEESEQESEDEEEASYDYSGYDRAFGHIASDDDLVVAPGPEKSVRFAEPLVQGEDAPQWQHGEFKIGVAFTLNPEANSNLAGLYSWAQTQALVGLWGVDVDELATMIGSAMERMPRMYRDDRMTIHVFPQYVFITVTIDSALNAHNTGIIATLTDEGAYAHYVQFKDLVMFYTDESDMDTPIYNVLKTFGDPWAGGTAESYVVRHGRGRKAYFTVDPVRTSHEQSVAAVVRRCSGGLDVRVLSARPQ
ncbi:MULTISPECIES: hypothetical protein [Micromonospora]|uniref:Uncharacterized protein n=1 Tax=Micromonospora antibiotica TaxID=2807623 RepID=A0ABS3V3C3_9ACTN|nr:MULTISPECIES: hypothetical protein [Micromonospora]MBO4160123.1 hypothetical protein [Micromonospora antibiotica]MBW4704661.1 hypothetical protein [Micromonospora sp. RL09-050-HVF-A]